jgi:hypothetical protein
MEVIMKRKSIIIAAAVAATVGATALVFGSSSYAQPYGGGYMGPGMMGGYGGGPGYGPGMMGDYGPGWMYGRDGYGPGYMHGGQGYGPGYMHGRGGYGPGWMHGGQGYGPGWMHGQRGYGPGWCWGNRDDANAGPPAQSQSGQATPQQSDEKQTDQKQQTDQKLTIDNVKARMERWLSFHRNPRLKLGDVKEKDADTITADIVTVDNSLVQRFDVDRNTGRYVPEQGN